MKVYAPKTKALAADVAIQEAVDRATRLLTNAAVVERNGAMTPRLRYEVETRVNSILLTAGEMAHFLLDERPAKKAAARKGAS